MKPSGAPKSRTVERRDEGKVSIFAKEKPPGTGQGRVAVRLQGHVYFGCGCGQGRGGARKECAARGASAGIGAVRGATLVVFDEGCAAADSGAAAVGVRVRGSGADAAGFAGAAGAVGCAAAADGAAAVLAAAGCAAFASLAAAYFSSVGHQA